MWERFRKSVKDAESPEVGNSRKWLLSLGLKTNEGTVSGRAAATGEKPLVKGYSYYQIKVQEGGKNRTSVGGDPAARGP